MVFLDKSALKKRRWFASSLMAVYYDQRERESQRPRLLLLLLGLFI